MQIHLSKTTAGWQAHSTIDLDDGRVLSLITVRSTRFRASLVTKAVVSTPEEDGLLRCAAPSENDVGDYQDAVIVSAPPRLTKAVVREQQARALAGLESIKASVEQHYARQFGAVAADA